MPRGTRTALFLVTGACALGVAPAPASAFNPIKQVCSVAGLFSGIAGKACSVVQNGGRLIRAGNKLFSGHVGGAVKSILGEGGGAVASKATTALGLAAIVTAALGGAKFALHETAKVLGQTTSPQLRTTWFSSMYWRIAGISAVLTLPFLFAAAIQALIHSDITLLLRSALGYLPLAMLAVSIAAPLTMLLLAASDQLSAVVSSAAGNESGDFLRTAGFAVGSLSVLSGSPFLAFVLGLVTIAGALVLWLELLMREAAVYVIVLMLPLAFAALVWPARRIWALRAVELLVALILSKFAIVAVLSLGGAALSHSSLHSITGMLAGAVLLVLGAFAPWALLRLLPLAELASGAAGSLRSSAGVAGSAYTRAEGAGNEAENWISRTGQMRRDADDVAEHVVGPPPTASANQIEADPKGPQDPRTELGGASGAGVAGAEASQAPGPGSSGSSGASESNGAPGSSGASESNGAPGSNGASGSNGAHASSGAAATNGASPAPSESWPAPSSASTQGDPVVTSIEDLPEPTEPEDPHTAEERAHDVGEVLRGLDGATLGEESAAPAPQDGGP